MPQVTAEAVLKDLKNRQFHPVYFLCGEEPFYIDQISSFIESSILDESERDFNQSILYGLEVSASDVVAVAKRFPMMSEYQVVLVKEAQLMKGMEALEPYILKPQPSTVLVICYKGKEPDKRKTFSKILEKEAVYVKSDRLKDDKIPEWIGRFLFKRGFKIQPKAAIMMAEFVGNELEKVANEAEKLMVNFQTGYEFTEKDIERIVGVSREYNVFELQKALGKKDIFTANKIAFFMAGNPKNHPIQAILGSFIGYFSKVLHYQWLRSKGNTDFAKSMGVNPYFIRDYEIAANNYSPAKIIRIIHHLRDNDMRSKGVNNESASGGDLLKELVFKILH
ncbi:MAG: DNA polymerase III subunit delta [Bacteroidia bacterium]|nr:DNA polymerase III subunit delta [Bacteroidia bacterium]